MSIQRIHCINIIIGLKNRNKAVLFKKRIYEELLKRACYEKKECK